VEGNRRPVSTLVGSRRSENHSHPSPSSTERGFAPASTRPCGRYDAKLFGDYSSLAIRRHHEYLLHSVHSSYEIGTPSMDTALHGVYHREALNGVWVRIAI
jgi:hypothetical protein